MGWLEIWKEFAPFFGFDNMFLFNFSGVSCCDGFHYPLKDLLCFLSFIYLFILQIRLRDYGVLDFDAGDARRQPPVDTTWQQVLDTSICIL